MGVFSHFTHTTISTIMDLPQVIAVILALTAVLSVVNERFIKMPLSIGVMVITMVISVLGIISSQLGLFQAEMYMRAVVERIDFSETLMHGMLSSMLFAGALHIDLSALIKQKWPITFLAIFGTIISTLLVGYSLYYAFHWLGLLDLPLIYCLLFGALISPTDPIAVLAIMRRVGAPEELEILISGESLFNDGVGVVLFSVIAAMAFSGQEPTALHALELFAHEMLGGIVFGLVLGFLGNYLLKQVVDYHMDALITLAVSFCGYQVATLLGVSGLISVVVAGLVAGEYVRKNYPADELGRTPLDIFWKIIDELLNAVLFVLIGAELVSFGGVDFPFMATAIVIVIMVVVRFISVVIPITILKGAKHPFASHVVRFMTWGGLRGGLPVALALSLPESEARETLVLLTYGAVAFSIIVQGLTISPLMRYWMRSDTVKSLHS